MTEVQVRAEVDEQVRLLIEQMFQARTFAREWQTIYENLREDVNEALGEADEATFDGEPIVRRVPQRSPYFDRTRFRKDFPDLAERYTEERFSYRMVAP